MLISEIIRTIFSYNLHHSFSWLRLMASYAVLRRDCMKKRSFFVFPVHKIAANNSCFHFILFLMKNIKTLVYGTLNKEVPSALDRNQFSSWLTGFIDGEGNFQVLTPLMSHLNLAQAFSSLVTVRLSIVHCPSG
jgi:hypothetical protein